MAVFIGKGYSAAADTADLSGRPLLVFFGPDPKKPILLSDRIAQDFDPTVPQVVDAHKLHTPRLDNDLATLIKTKLGGANDDELDHKIPLELGGSNMLSNLQLQPGRVGGPSAASDRIETTLAARVAAGQISLQFAWLAIAQQKGFLLGEESPQGVEFSFADKLHELLGIINQLPSARKSGAAGIISENTQEQIASNLKLLKENPLDLKARDAFFRAQIDAVAQKTGVSTTEAGAIVGGELGAYAEANGSTRQEVASMLSSHLQALLNLRATGPAILGIPSSKIIEISAIFTGLSGGLLLAGFAAFIIGIFAIGPALAIEAVTAGGIGLLEQLLGLTVAGSFGPILIRVATLVGAFSFATGFIVKEFFDNTVLPVTQQIDALTKIATLQKTLGVGFQNEKIAEKAIGGTSATALRGSGGGGKALFVGHIQGGTLGALQPFHAEEATRIGSADELANIAQHNIGAFMSAVPNSIRYHIALKTAVAASDGAEIVGTTYRYQKGVTKKGKPTYGHLTNQYAVLDIFFHAPDNRPMHLAQLILGPVDELAYKPSHAELADLSNTLSRTAVQTTMQGVSHIQITPQGGVVPAGPVFTRTGLPAGPAPERIQTNFPAFVAKGKEHLFFREQGGWNGQMYRDAPPEIITYDLLDELTLTEKQNIGNVGAQAREVERRLAALGFSVTDVPQKNLADMMSACMHRGGCKDGGFQKEAISAFNALIAA